MIRVLMAATVPSMIGQFNMDNIRILLDIGCKVDVACDFRDRSAWPEERIRRFENELDDLGIGRIQIDFSRSPLRADHHMKSLRQMNHLLKERNYSFIHTHTPIASAIVRLAAHHAETKVIYTAHGFHFYRGASLKNWCIFYPVEWFFSRWTEVLITITREDYVRAKKRLHAKKTAYVPGVGIDPDRFKTVHTDSADLRKELGIPQSAVMLLSVGELNENKNHRVVIEALREIEGDYHYVIAGTGSDGQLLRNLADQNGVQLHLLGYRNDIPALLSCADAYLLPSIREGLNVSLMEAMAGGLPCICSDIRGNNDLIDANGGIRVPAEDVSEWADAIIRITKKEYKSAGLYNQKKVEKFSKENVRNRMKRIYQSLA